MGTDTEPPGEGQDALVASPVEDFESGSLPAGLTPLRAHYLKKSLIQLQLNQEIEAILNAAPNNESTLSHLGPPFSPPRKAHHRLICLPSIYISPVRLDIPDFYSEKLQPFVASMLSRNLSPNYDILDEGADVAEQAARTKMLGKLERSLSTFLGTSIKLVEREEVVRLTQTDLDRLEMLAKKRQARLAKNKEILKSTSTVVAKGRVRSRSHDEFIIRTRRSRYRDVFVARRYGDFKTLATELRKAHHDEDIPSPPVKDRSTVSVPPSTPSPGSLYTSFSGSSQQPPNILSSPSDDSLQSFGTPVSPTMRSPLSSQQAYLRGYLVKRIDSR
ncbi:px domain-containing protein [Salix suchowensis]|nr:px domain-containing protein [Salix suchowensis]